MAKWKPSLYAHTYSPRYRLFPFVFSVASNTTLFAVYWSSRFSFWQQLHQVNFSRSIFTKNDDDLCKTQRDALFYHLVVPLPRSSSYFLYFLCVPGIDNSRGENKSESLLIFLFCSSDSFRVTTNHVSKRCWQVHNSFVEHHHYLHDDHHQVACSPGKNSNWGKTHHTPRFLLLRYHHRHIFSLFYLRSSRCCSSLSFTFLHLTIQTPF